MATENPVGGCDFFTGSPEDDHLVAARWSHNTSGAEKSSCCPRKIPMCSVRVRAKWDYWLLRIGRGGRSSWVHTENPDEKKRDGRRRKKKKRVRAVPSTSIVRSDHTPVECGLRLGQFDADHQTGGRRVDHSTDWVHITPVLVSAHPAIGLSWGGAWEPERASLKI